MSKLTKEAIAKVFEANPAYNTLHFTSDGQAFLSENYAKQHAKTLDDISVESIDKEIEFSEADDETDEPNKWTAAELIELIDAAKSIEELEDLELPEGEERASVIEAFAARKSELEAE